MRSFLFLLLSALCFLSFFGCHEKGQITILFTGDVKGWLRPAG